MGKPKIRPPHNQTPDRKEIKFGAVDYVREGTRNAKFYANSFKGASRQMGEIYAFFIYIKKQNKHCQSYIGLGEQATHKDINFVA